VTGREDAGETPPKTPLRVLVVEDSEYDTMLLAEELRRGGYEPDYGRVSTADEMEEALAKAQGRGAEWQIIVSDYYMPRFSGPEALALMRRLGYETPFIVVSGKIGEEAAVAMMRSGAQDYVSKDNMARLCPAIERELREAAVRREREETQVALRESEQRFRAVFEQATDAFYLVDAESRRILESNPAFRQMLGYSEDEAKDIELYELIAHSREDVDYNLWLTLAERRRFVGERKYRHKDGSVVEVETAVGVIRYGGRDVVCAVLRDITERKEAERRLAEVREAERSRIARDLHDDILQDIAYALQEIQIVQITSGDCDVEALEDAAEALRRSVDGLRASIFELRVGTLSRSFLSALEALVELNRRMSRNRYELVLNVQDGFPLQISERAGRQLTRVVQEALTNVRRHAEARRAEVRLWREGDLALVEIADDGRGFEVEAPREGVGQQSMVHRVTELGGELVVESAPGEGTRVRVLTPVARIVEGEAAADKDGVQ
jgi:PAS domain S-box-containing protein